ncbi:hypothetical protein [Lacrimispora amygdalina]|uniref:hypothetical protein n=1 Tax=Lacrimispora amygdalina TaxID=253257 RepID=UPI0014782215|nr:hypothetical protein [Clostridium indicum]
MEQVDDVLGSILMVIILLIAGVLLLGVYIPVLIEAFLVELHALSGEWKFETNEKVVKN